MCDMERISKTESRRLEQIALANYQRNEGKIEVDESFAYFKDKSVSKELWRAQSLNAGLPPDIYLEIASMAPNKQGFHTVHYDGQKFIVGVTGTRYLRGKEYHEISWIVGF